jgi:hypothetical protein
MMMESFLESKLFYGVRSIARCSEKNPKTPRSLRGPVQRSLFGEQKNECRNKSGKVFRVFTDALVNVYYFFSSSVAQVSCTV